MQPAQQESIGQSRALFACLSCTLSTTTAQHWLLASPARSAHQLLSSEQVAVHALQAQHTPTALQCKFEHCQPPSTCTCSPALLLGTMPAMQLIDTHAGCAGIGRMQRTLSCRCTCMLCWHDLHAARPSMQCSTPADISPGHVAAADVYAHSNKHASCEHTPTTCRVSCPSCLPACTPPGDHPP